MKAPATVAEVNRALECDAHVIIGAKHEWNGELKIHEINFRVVCRTHARVLRRWRQRTSQQRRNLRD